MRYAVIAVTEGQAHANALRAIFDETEELELVDLLEGGGDVLHAVSRRECHVVLIDSAVSWTSPYEIVRELQSRLPHIAVLVVEQLGNPQALEAAVDAGARGLVNLAESFEEVRRKVLSAAQWSLKVRGMRVDTDLVHAGGSTIIALVGSKGGVGTTSLALHFARHQSALSTRVCLVDLDLSKGSVALFANIEPRRDISDLASLGEGLSVQAIEDVVFIGKEGGHYLCAPRHPEHGEDISGESIRSLLITLRQTYEFIILDCGASPTDVMGSALEVADEVLLVVTQDLASMRGAHRIIDMCDRLSIRSADEIHVLINKSNKRSDIQSATVKRMLRSSLHPVEIADNPREFEAANNSRNPALIRSKEFLLAMQRLVESFNHKVGASPQLTMEVEDASIKRRGRGDRRNVKTEAGVITVEFVVLVPFIVLLFVLCLQTIMYAGARVQASHAAGAAASAAARGDDYRLAAENEVNDGYRAGLEVTSPDFAGGYVDVRASVEVNRIVPAFFMGDGRVSVEGSAVEEK